MRRVLLLLVAASVAAPAVGPGAVAADGPPGGPLPLVGVTVAGGFTTPQFAYATLPRYWVAADGRLITQGPQIAIYPPPALPNLTGRQLSKAARTKLLAAAVTAGLTKKAPDYGRPRVADVGTTTITVRRTSRSSWTHEIYALGFDDARTGLGLTAPQIAARARVQKFLRLLADPVKAFGARNVGPEKPYTPTWFRAWATAVPVGDAPASAPIAGDLPAAAPREWPVPDVDLATTGNCAPVPATTELLAALRQVSQIQQWRQGGVVYDVVLRAVLPGEAVCPTA